LVLAGLSIAQRIAGRRGVRQFIKFGIVGLSGTLVNFAVYHGLLHFALDNRLAYAAGFILGGVNNYWWNRQWTFRSKGHAGKELVQFISVSAVALLISEIVLWFSLLQLPHTVPLRNSVAWLFATVVGMGWNFFVNKYWTFRHVHQPPAPEQA
jgi:putative flippase GtrA